MADKGSELFQQLSSFVEEQIAQKGVPGAAIGILYQNIELGMLDGRLVGQAICKGDYLRRISRRRHRHLCRLPCVKRIVG